MNALSALEGGDSAHNSVFEASARIERESHDYFLFGSPVSIPFDMPFSSPLTSAGTGMRRGVRVRAVRARRRKETLPCCRCNKARTRAVLTDSSGRRSAVSVGGSIWLESSERESTSVRFSSLKSSLALLLSLQGNALFHAASFRKDDRAFLLLGDSGAGKSTTAAFLEKQGMPLIADDVIMVTAGASGPEVLWTGLGKTLTAEAAMFLRLDVASGIASAATGKIWFPPEPRVGEAAEPVPLGGIFALVSGDSENGDLDTRKRAQGDVATAGERLYHLLASLVMPNLLFKVRPQGTMSLLGSVASTCFMFRIVKGEDLAALPQIAEIILERIYAPV